ncbi:MAG: VanW family protein [Armatimonadota bacterium]|jgi:vancomycin resistance protein YoaR
MTAQSDLGKTDTLAAVETEDDASGPRTKLILIIAGAALATILVVGVIGLAIATSSWVRSGEIAQNVTIAGIDVSGMTRDEAAAALRDRWIPSLPEKVAVTFPGGEWEAERDELGVSFKLDVAAQQAVRVGREGGLLEQMRARLSRRGTAVDIEVPVTIDEDTLDAAIGGLAGDVYRDPVNADIKVSGTNVEVIPGVVGRQLDIDATMDAVKAALTDPTADAVEAVVETTQPSVTAEDLSHIEVVLASYSTPYKASQVDRTHNLKLAAQRLNEVVVHPGEQFSFNGTVGQRLATDGYREAPIFIDGEVEPSLAGGICQIASTLYNVALLANLDIVQRYKHSRPVDYVPTGRDATVYWGVYDLKFKNSLKHPILLLTSVGSGQVSFKILGSREDRADVEIIREGLSRIPHETKENKDPELEEGKKEVEKEGRDGWRVTVYRKATRDGKVIRDERLHTDVYSAQTRVVRVGSKPRPEEPPAETEAPTPAAPSGPAAGSGGTAPVADADAPRPDPAGDGDE